MIRFNYAEASRRSLFVRRRQIMEFHCALVFRAFKVTRARWCGVRKLGTGSLGVGTRFYPPVGRGTHPRRCDVVIDLIAGRRCVALWMRCAMGALKSKSERDVVRIDRRVNRRKNVLNFKCVPFCDRNYNMLYFLHISLSFK